MKNVSVAGVLSFVKPILAKTIIQERQDFVRSSGMLWLLMLTVCIISGCAKPRLEKVARPIELTRVYEQKHFPGSTIHFPSLNVESEAQIGENMIYAIRKAVIPALILENGVDYFGVYRGVQFSLTLPPGKYVLHGDSPEGVYYRSENGVQIRNKRHGGGVFLPNDEGKQPEVYWSDDADVGGVVNVREIKGLNIKRTTIDEWRGDSFKIELLYTGVSQNTVSILYQEFSDAAIRPAFTKELKYDLSQGDIIGYGGARLKIIKATNTYIKYKLLRPLKE
jgi:hypothetical protein